MARKRSDPSHMMGMNLRAQKKEEEGPEERGVDKKEGF
jgi:hypothetical protein